MATVQDLKRRIRSIRNTRKITKAMELVASARLRRAQARIEAMRPYADRMMELMVGTARASTSLRGLPLLQRREVRTAAVVPLTGDRGLAGAFNAQILREAFGVERTLREERIAPRVAELYANQEVDRVVLIYNHFESALVQRVVRQDVLPIPEDVLEKEDE